MNTSPAQPDSTQRIEHILSTLSKYRTLWIAPAVIGMMLSAVYVFALRQQNWSANQSLIVRDDLLGQSFKPGRFDSIESMKSAQETILEIARKPQVVGNALKQLGPESNGLFGLDKLNWPSEETIESVQGSISFHAPNGAEFGKTEVIVLNTKASTRDRSRKFIELLLNEIIVKAGEVRTLRLRSMESELIQTRDAVVAALDESKSKIQDMDEILGTDFGSMNSMSDMQFSDNIIKRDISEISTEKRQAEVQLERGKAALAAVVDAKNNPQRDLSISADLIAMLPTLDFLKKEMTKTQGELAVIEGQYQPAHPMYRKAKASIDSMKKQMHLELDSSIAGLQNGIKITQNTLLRLDRRLASLNQRLVNLGSNRANSMTLIAEWKERSEIANKAQSDLAEIQGLLQSRNADLITRVDDPQVSTRPDGLGKKATVLAFGLGGLMLGLGLVMLVAPPIGEEQQRASARRGGDNSDTTGGQTVDSFFDSNTFEKIIVSAATAATTAIQSAAKARQYFMPPRTEHDDSVERESSESQRTATAQAAKKIPNAVYSETDSTDLSTIRPTSQVPPGTPSVSDLLDAAKAIAIPAPVASQPLSSPPEKIEIRPTEPKPTMGKFTVRTVNPGPQPATVAEPSVAEATVAEVSTKQAKSNPVSELAAIQLAALRGARVQPSTPTPPFPPRTAPSSLQASEGKNTSPIEPSPAKGVQPMREEPQMIVVSDKSSRGPVRPEDNASNDGPILADPVAKLTRRGPNVRPVDLARSAEDEDSTFVRINLSADGSKTKKQVSDSGQPPTSKAAEPQFANPRLKDGAANPTTEAQDVHGWDNTNSMAVPDQIQKLSDSIAKFANPTKMENNDD